MSLWSIIIPAEFSWPKHSAFNPALFTIFEKSSTPSALIEPAYCNSSSSYCKTTQGLCQVVVAFVASNPVKFPTSSGTKNHIHLLFNWVSAWLFILSKNSAANFFCVSLTLVNCLIISLASITFSQRNNFSASSFWCIRFAAFTNGPTEKPMSFAVIVSALFKIVFNPIFWIFLNPSSQIALFSIDSGPTEQTSAIIPTAAKSASSSA